MLILLNHFNKMKNTGQVCSGRLSKCMILNNKIMLNTYKYIVFSF